jgi:hypothetical protein
MKKLKTELYVLMLAEGLHKPIKNLIYSIKNDLSGA